MKNAIAFGLGALTVVTLTWVATVGVQAQEPIDTNTITSVSETTSSTSSSTSSTSTSSTTSTIISQQTTAIDEATGDIINLIDGCDQVHPFPDYTGMTQNQLSKAGPRDFWGCSPLLRLFWGYDENGNRIPGGMPCVDGSEPTVESQFPLPNTQISLSELATLTTEVTWVCGS
jgi:hypothetical protein